VGVDVPGLRGDNSLIALIYLKDGQPKTEGVEATEDRAKIEGAERIGDQAKPEGLEKNEGQAKTEGVEAIGEHLLRVISLRRGFEMNEPYGGGSGNRG
jgi:hypothetical protein